MGRASTHPARRPQIRLLRAMLRANAQIVEGHRVMQAAIGLKMSEFDLLASLGNTDGIRMTDLARMMITSPSNVTRVARVLEDRGLVERRRSEHSDREVVCRLTPAGEKLFDDTFMRVAEFDTRAMDRALSVKEQKQLADLLDRFSLGLDYDDL